MDWSKEELDAAVQAYIKMRDLQLAGIKFTKKSIYEELSSQFVRTPKAFEFRMQNISYVYSVLGRQWVKGLKPAAHVGTNVLLVIEALIAKHEKTLPTNNLEFEMQVARYRRDTKLKAPSGSIKPTKKIKESASYVRDPRVTAWVINNSNGSCESCDQPSPFTKSDGDFYLEVHHLRRLADGGSDTIANTVAVCPNCHRRLHYSSDREVALTKLYEKLPRLNRE